jgi:hypothetical protein
MNLRKDQFMYKTVMNKFDFERQEAKDSVHFDIYGFDNFFVSRLLRKTKKEEIRLDWDMQTLKVSLKRIDRREGIIIATMPMINENVLDWTIDFYTKEKKHFDDER